MKNYILEIKDESKTQLIKDLLVELGLTEINQNNFVERRSKPQISPKKISDISPKT